MRSRVTEVVPAESAVAAERFESCLQFETDCYDVHEAMAGGQADFVLLDVRSAVAFSSGHVPGAVHLPHARIDEDSLADYRSGTVFVAYCAGPHCNGAHRAAARLARLGRPVKIMIGGIAGWADEGFDLRVDSIPSDVTRASESSAE